MAVQVGHIVADLHRDFIVLEADLDDPVGCRREWHHLAAVRDDANNTITLYLDGVSQGTKSA